MNGSDRGQVRKRKLIAAGAFNEKLYFFSVSINTSGDGQIFVHVERKKKQEKTFLFSYENYYFP